MRNARGQMTIEMMLLLALLVGLMISFSKYAQSEKFMQNLVSGPWKPLKGMIEDGVWKADSHGDNPAMKYRHGSYDGDDP